MGFFSLFSSRKTVQNDMPHDASTNFNKYLDRDFFAGIVDHADSMMLYFFQGDGWIGANKRFFKMMDFKNIEEFVTQNESVRDIFLSESEEIFTESDKSWLDYIKKYKPNGYRTTMLDRNNNVIQIEAKCHIFSKNKNFYVLELKDITQLYDAQVKTREVEQLKTEFLANIGHEFRTPMNGILGFVELIKQTDLDKHQQEYINMINHSSRNLMTNIETLLDLSQLQSGRLELHTSEFNILPEMEKLAYNYCILGSQKGIKVLTFIDPKLPQELFGDLKKITKVMSALSQNAIKYTPRGGRVIIEVKLLKRQKNGDCSIGFGVRDNGKGISHEQILAINEPFTSGNQADERLGVGLALSHGLVDLLGSELKIQSKEESGTYVNFMLSFKGSLGQNYKMMPKKKVKVLLLDQTKVDEANFLTIYLRSFAIDVIKSNVLDANVYNGVEALYIVANQNDSSWMLELGTYSKKTPLILLLDRDEKLQTKLTHIVDEVIKKPLLPSTIAKHLYAKSEIPIATKSEEPIKLNKSVDALVVEDNLINQRLIQIILQGYNINVATASNGHEAITMSENNKYDIIFMDIDMPGKNGIEATNEIKEGRNPNKHTPIVALTAMAMEGDREMLLAKGLDNYLAKPLRRDRLEEILQKYLKVAIEA
jgi:CheY-like chemotaxis protein/signal transduction histidine kinase